MSGWYYKLDGKDQAVGPRSDDEMARCAARGGLKLDSLVMHEDKTNGQWIEARHVVGLRKRITASDAPQGDESKADVKGYVPPAERRWAARMTAMQQGLHETAAWASGATSAVATSLHTRLTTRAALHVCTKCGREFSHFHTAGRCPLCGEWEPFSCGVCGYASDAKPFVENKCKCPRCGNKVDVPGAAAVSWGMAGLIALLLVGLASVILIAVIR